MQTAQTALLPATPLQTLLDDIRSTSRSETDKGTAFEDLCIRYLQNEPEYKALYREVQPYKDWAAQHGQALGLTANDKGIDLVATTTTGEYHAVQCKCYAADHSVAKPDIDSFLSASGHKAFAARLLIDTTFKPYGANAEEMLQHQHIPVMRIDVQKLETSQIDWSQYKISQPAAPLFDGATPTQDTLALKPKHSPRPHQQKAIDAVLNGLKTADRGKLIMACGTGKTFTALKIAEALTKHQAGAGKTILFLVPSLALLSQTLTEWSQQSQVSITAFAVCSDSEVGKRKEKDDGSDRIRMALHELAYPATTDAAKLAQEYAARQTTGNAPDAMTVVFSTYHSIDVIRAAQQQGLPEFDLVICDEAHRTTGQTWLDDKTADDESAFVRIHDHTFIRAKKRLYMTATPRIYDSEAKKTSKDSQTSQDSQTLALYSMDDAAVYGQTLHTLNFSSAVEQKLLVPYKVIVLTVSEETISERVQNLLKNEDNSLRMDDIAKIVGCFKALAKYGLSDLTDDPVPMRRAVAFCQVIDRSRTLNTQKGNKTAAVQIAEMFSAVVKEYQENTPIEEKIALTCEADYVHGGMGASEKSTKIAWLKNAAANNNTTDNTCRILTNVRCLSEGVDVPALDAVLFLTPRNSQIEVVQSVGRVMRRATGKKRGYIILPVVVPAGVEPHRALNDNKTYKTVWQVLQALRSHDDEFDRFINRIELLGSDPQRIEVIDASAKITPRSTPQTREQQSQKALLASARKGGNIGAAESTQHQEELHFATGELERAILAKVVQKVGNRDYWEQWAQDIAEIAKRQITRIAGIIKDPKNTAAKAAFEGFTQQLHRHINTSISQDDIIEMLAQHLITKPVFDALFDSSDFTRANPVSSALQAMTDVLLRDFKLDKEHQTLEKFYDYIRKKTAGIHDPAARQTLIITLYDQFFAQAFPRVTQKHGIVYTPIEIVDFILASVAHVLHTQFGKSFHDDDVQVLDPFTGTGTFIARLIASGLIAAGHLPKVYARQLHATEILLLPYYIAAVNIESTFAQAQPQAPYTPFPGILLADTFNIPTEKTETLLENKHDTLAANNERRKRQMASKITVIVGNPPYSVGQRSENDDNKNVRYDQLDKRIETTYAAKSRAVLKKALRDSYIRAIRWASDRIDKATGGIIGFVTNAGWLDSAATDGLRHCLAQEFSSLYVFHLRGDIRGEMRSNVKDKKEGGNVFGQGSTTGIAISILVKTPQHTDNSGDIFFCDIGDYLSREEKLQKIAELSSIHGIAQQNLWQRITPDAHSDWLNQRQGDFAALLPMGDAKNKNKPGNTGIFENFSLGVVTNRDAWCNNPSRAALLDNIRRLVDFYEAQRKANTKGALDTDPTKISWTRALKADLARDKVLTFHPHAAVPTLYRPFSKGWLYYDRRLNEMVYQMPQIFPLPAAADAASAENQENRQGRLLPESTPQTGKSTYSNRLICVSTVGTRIFSVLMTDHITDLHLFGSGTQCFPQYLIDASGQPKDGITDATLSTFQTRYQTQDISKAQLFHYIYAILHSPDYRAQWAHNLTKELPRIPFAASLKDFLAFADAGQRLGDLHCDFESAPLYDGVQIEGEASGHYRVEKMKHGKTGKDKDRSTIIYNPHITIRNIPERAWDYVVNGRSAIDWVMERQAVRTDKASGIVSDANQYATETLSSPRYPLELLLRVITVSLQTLDIVQRLPALEVQHAQT